MEQAVAVFLVLGLFALLLGGAIVALVAYSRERTLTRRIESLEKTVHRLSSATRDARSHEPEPRAAAPVPQPIPTAPAPPVVPTIVPRPDERAPTPPRAHVTPPPPKPRVPLERALGVTGAAVLGGVVFAIAGIYLYQYSVQQGLLTPAVRVALGTVLGVACLGASELLRKRGYRITADSLAGGAIVVLFAAFWAANRLFQLWPFALSFGLMAVVTALCCMLALRHSSQVIAVLGLVGGFATPIALSTGEDRPIGLFGWTLLVNLGFLSVAHKRRWPMMGSVALFGTFVVEALWIFARMGPETFVLAVAVLAAFALLFVGFVALQPSDERARWRSSQVGAVFFPFLFAMYFSFANVKFAGGHFYSIALLAALLCAAAGFVARAPGLAVVPLGSAAGSVSLALVWLLSPGPKAAFAWEFVACCALIAIVLQVACTIGRPRPAEAQGASSQAVDRTAPAAIAAGGFAIAFAVGAARNPSVALWPWAAGWALLAVLHGWQAVVTRRPVISIASSVLSGIGFFTWVVAGRRSLEALPEFALLAALLGFVVLYQIVASRFANDPARRAAWWAAGIASLLAQATASSALGPHEPALRLLLGVILVFGALVAMAANGARSSALYAMGTVASANAMWTFGSRVSAPGSTSVLLMGLGATLFTLWPFVRSSHWVSSRFVWRVAAVAGLLWFFPLRHLWSTWLGTDAIGLVPIALAAIAGIGWWLTARDTTDIVQNVARVWFAALALSWLSFALPLQLDHDWVLVSLALAGASQVGLWTRYDHPPLKYVGCALLAFASTLLVLQRWSGSYPVYEAKLVNWLAWSYLVPAAAAMLASIWLARREIARLRATERPHYAQNVAWCASLCGLYAAVLFFAWLNLAILNAFGTRPSFQWFSERVPARDLTMSLAWALYALALLVLGVNRRIGGLRWVSLGLFVLTIAKVFLFDLGNLQGLYRVASLFGLAVALLFVSLLYQRFVFRVSPKDDGRGPAPDPAGAAADGPAAEPESSR